MFNILHKSPNLDLLRALAVCFVVTDHTARFLGHPFVLGCEMNWLGRLGVMFFFVHTCTVLMLSLERLRTEASPPRVCMAFYVRRLFRIYPLSIFAVLAVWLGSIPSAQIVGRQTLSLLRPSWMELSGNLLLIQNLWPKDARDIIGVLWSLPYEVQMYLLLPFLFYWLARRTQVWPLIVFWTLAWLPSHYITPLRFAPHFIGGVIAYSMSLRNRVLVLPWFILPALIFVSAAAFLLRPSIFFGAVICLVLGLLLPQFSRCQVEWLNKSAANVAKYSYGVYLSHLFSLWFAFNVVPRFHLLTFGALLVILPVVLYHVVESPLISLGLTLGEHITGARRRLPLVAEVAKTGP
jgi:peptidoglycan/LPS O-acetylase OafA/YrhL